MACKFNYGDRVTVKDDYGGHKGRIVSIGVHSGAYKCRVKFDNQFLVPSEMDYWEDTLLFQDSKDPSGCPTCGTKWTVTKFGQNVWKDCSKCGKKEEDILTTMKVKNKKTGSRLNTTFTKDNVYPPGVYSNGKKDPTTSKEEQELLEEFEKMLGSDDDQDDFGHYQP